MNKLKNILWIIALILVIALVAGVGYGYYKNATMEIKNPIARFVTLQLLRFASYISVRDEGSYNFLKKHKINSSLVCDPIYSVNVPQKVI